MHDCDRSLFWRGYRHDWKDVLLPVDRDWNPARVPRQSIRQEEHPRRTKRMPTVPDGLEHRTVVGEVVGGEDENNHVWLEVLSEHLVERQLVGLAGTRVTERHRLESVSYTHLT